MVLLWIKRAISRLQAAMERTHAVFDKADEELILQERN